jgi:hypothetical protein
MRRLDALVAAIATTRATSYGLMSWRAAWCQIAWGTGSGRSASRVAASLNASAACSASLKHGVSRQAAR